MTRALAGLVFIAALAAPAHAQQPATGTPDGRPLGSVGLTFSLLRFEGETAKAGFGFDVSRTVGQSANNVGIQIAADLGVNYFAGSSDASFIYYGTTQTSFMGGIRLVGLVQPKATPFAQALVGAVRCCGETDAALMFGGGVEVPISGRRVNVRLQVDVPVVFYKAGTDDDGVGYTAGHDLGLRFNIGVGIAIGGR